MHTLKQIFSPKSSIGRRVFLGYGLIFLFAIATTIYTIYTFNSISSINDERNRILDARRAARSLDVDVLRIVVSLQYYVDSAEPTLLREVEVDRQQAAGLRKELRAATKIPRVVELLDKYEAILPERRALFDSIVEQVQAGEKRQDLTTELARRRTLDDEARSYLREIIDIEEKASRVVLNQFNTQLAAAKRRIILINIPLLITIVTFGIILVRSLTRPLKLIDNMTKRIGQGDFSPSQVSKGSDEFTKLETSMNDMSKALAELDKSKSEFISLVSHQLRTPATAVKQSLGMIVDNFTDDPKQIRSFIETAYNSNEEQLQIVDDILNVAKIDAGKLELKTESVDLIKLTESAVNQLKTSAKEKKQTLNLVVPKQPLSAVVDKLKITMVIENLVSNAIKYTPEKGIITVTLKSQDNHHRLTVSDNGIGISLEEQKKLFKKFGRIENESTIKIKGTGLGLYLVKQFVEMHGGSITVESERNKGTSFIIKLPKE